MLPIDETSSDQCLDRAAALLAGSEGVVLLEGRVALRPARSAILCEVIDPAPGAHRCEEEFRVMVENASRLLAASRLGSRLPRKSLRWSVVEDRETGAVELWPGS